MQSRYRLEGGRSCIDLHLQNASQLFDGRDPAPFRERDLDDDAVEYLLGAADDLGAHRPFKVVVWVAEPTPGLGPATLEAAMRAHFDYELTRLGRTVRQHTRRAELALLLGVGVLVAFLSLAELTQALPVGAARQILREGLVIFGWVAMWRPLELILYDWWPLVAQRRRLQRLRDAEITVLEGPPPAV
ncbi:MAG: hypothetical protein IT376_21700 [Polyangiaceae bacterium]|nr:hypothetical protein [Polyangiaceae bacterium]